MIEEIIILVLFGLVFGTGLVLASRKFAVRVDKRVEIVGELLPGANCGVCGFAQCGEFASALVDNPSLIDKCAQVSSKAKGEIGELLGVKVKKEKPKVARLACTGGSKVAFEYHGAKSCRAAAILMGGFLECKHGCLGLGDCAIACPFNAIEVKDGKISIDEEKCTGCGACVDICPKNVIKLVPADVKVLIRCNSPEPSKVVVSACKNGCIACKLCEKACPVNAIKIENNLPVINQELCVGCGACVKACPRGVLELLGKNPNA